MSSQQAPPRTQGLPAPELVVSVPGGSQAHRLDQPILTLGRATDNNIVVNYPIVSRHHARLEQHNGSYKLINLSNMNPLLLGGRPIPEVDLKDGMEVRIGDGQGNSVSLRYKEGLSGAGQPPPTALRIKGQGITVIGRDPSAGLPLRHPTVSWRHAQVEVVGGQYLLSDLGSLNGTFVNGQRITRTSLKRGDVVQIGAYTLTFSSSALTSSAGQGMRLDGIDLCKTAKDKSGLKVLLDHISLCIYPGEFVALVGGSGAGKSTLLGALNGFRPAQGAVLIDGDNLYDHFDVYRPRIGYVPQSDIVHRTLPVSRALDYVARLRLPPDMGATERNQRIDDVLATVDISLCKDRVIEKLSGGQQKRVSTAVELLAGPELMFLDEPTSGLDPGLDKRLMYTMRQLANDGRTVALVTHATANIRQCDHVAFLAPGGRLAFFGPPDEALRYFGESDFADIYTELEHTNLNVAEEFRKSPEYARYVANRLQQRPPASLPPSASGPRVQFDPARSLHQFLVLSQRYADIVVRDSRNLAFLLLQAPVIAALLWLVAKADDFTKDPWSAQRVVFIMACAAVWFGVINACREIAKEMPIYRRERMAGVGIVPYVASKIVVLSILALVQVALLLGLVVLRVGAPRGWDSLPTLPGMFITLFLVAVAGLTTGLLISALVSNEDRAVSIVPVILIPQLVLAGIIFELKGPSAVLSRLMVSHWGTRALGSIVDLCTLPLADCNSATMSLPYTHTLGAVLVDWLALIIYSGLFLALAGYALKRKDVL